MLRTALAALAVLFLSVSPALANHIRTAENVSVMVRDDVRVQYIGSFRQEAKDENKSEDVCSGFVIGTAENKPIEFVLTARHCMGFEEESFFGMPIADVSITPRQVEFFDGDVGRVVKAIPWVDGDVGLLIVQSHHYHSPLLRPFAPIERGDPMFVFGMPDGYAWAYSSATPRQGLVLSDFQSGQPGFLNEVQLECTSCYGGDSGGGVFNDKGQLAGMLVADMGDPAAFLMVPNTRIVEAITAVLEPPRNPACLTDVAAAAAERDESDPGAFEDRSLNYELPLILNCEIDTQFDKVTPSWHGRISHTRMAVAELGLLEEMAAGFAMQGDQGDTFAAYSTEHAERDRYLRWASMNNDPSLANAVNDFQPAFDATAATQGWDQDPSVSEDAALKSRAHKTNIWLSLGKSLYSPMPCTAFVHYQDCVWHNAHAQ